MRNSKVNVELQGRENGRATHGTKHTKLLFHRCSDASANASQTTENSGYL